MAHKCKKDITTSGLNLVGGLDISFRNNGNAEIGTATLAILSWPELKVSVCLYRSILGETLTLLYFVRSCIQ